MSYQWTVTAAQRLDAFLADQNPQVSRSRIQKAIRSGGVEVNGEEVCKPSFSVQEGDIVYLPADWDEREESVAIEPADLQLPVLYEDDDCLVLDKPAGYAVHPGTGMAPDEKTILHGVAHLFAERSLPFSSGGVLVHRLDRDTTGCLLVAKTPEAHAALQKQFERRDVRKLYLALVAGEPDPPKAVIDAPIGRSLTDRTTMSVLRTGKSREARTTYRTLETTGAATLLQCDLHTGRTHQVRVHLSSVGYPILGDGTYATAASRDLAEQYGAGSLCLHAWKLTFFSSVRLEEISVSAPLPVSFVQMLGALNLSVPA